MIPNVPARSLRDVLRAWSDARPDAPALHAPGRAALSFAALSRAAEDVPGTLHDAGVVRANIVVCALDDRLLLGALAATLPAGAIFAPVGPQLAREQYVTLLARLHPAAVIVPHAEHALATVAREAGIVIMEPHPCADEEGPAYTLSVCASGRMGTTPAQYDPAIAYVVVTSGTTARSKLVPVRERQSLLRAAAMQQWLQYGTDDVMCHVMPMYFSHGLRNGLIDPLLGGAGVMCLAEADVDGFLRTAGEGSVTAVTASFTFYREVVARVVAGYSPRNGRMRFLRVGSGTLTDDEIDVIERAFAAPVLGGYSSTETSVVSHDPLPPQARKRGGAGILVGGAIATLDEHAHLLPQGEPGEIAVRSEFVCDGYLDDDALNVQSFVMPVHIDANFFLAGGDSLCGARLLARIERTFGVRLSLHALFGEAQNLRDMARIIALGGDAGTRSEGEDDLPPLVARASAPDADTPA